MWSNLFEVKGLSPQACPGLISVEIRKKVFSMVIHSMGYFCDVMQMHGINAFVSESIRTLYHILLLIFEQFHEKHGRMVEPCMMTHSSLSQTKCTRTPTKRRCSPTETILVGRLAALLGSSKIFRVHLCSVDVDGSNQS